MPESLEMLRQPVPHCPEVQVDWGWRFQPSGLVLTLSLEDWVNPQEFRQLWIKGLQGQALGLLCGAERWELQFWNQICHPSTTQYLPTFLQPAKSDVSPLSGLCFSSEIPPPNCQDYSLLSPLMAHEGCLSSCHFVCTQ